MVAVADVDVEEGVVQRGMTPPMKMTVAVTSLSRPMDQSLRGVGGKLSDSSFPMAAPVAPAPRDVSVCLESLPHISNQKEPPPGAESGEIEPSCRRDRRPDLLHPRER